MPKRPPPRVLLVSPRFNPDSFWSFRATCELRRARWLAPPLGLITLAAMLPDTWRVRLVDRNVGELDADDIAGADLVMTGGMLPQEPDLLAVMRMCAEAGTPVCVGGPAPTSTPENFAHADFLVVGEAEGVIADFVEAWQRGDATGRFVAPKFQADITTTPIPRFDLLRFRDYLYVNVQFSRGCPFTCEFCDIIELYGRVPRTKTPPQMLAELDQLYRLGHRGHVDFVDDNLIGNKKAIRGFLPHLVAWQKKHGYPFRFSTEASLNLADDPDLLALLRVANFGVLFTGIETPDAATLVQTQKKQNTRRDIADSVHRIIEAGLYVTAGFIIGFDEERQSVAQPMIGCIERAEIPAAMVNLLTALPNTQLARRLKREGRLYDDFRRPVAESGDHSTAGLNFETLRSRREILLDYREVVGAVYSPSAYFRRVRRLGRRVKPTRFLERKIWWSWVRNDAMAFVRLAWLASVRHPELAGPFWFTLYVTLRDNPRAVVVVAEQAALYAHLYPYSRALIAKLDGLMADLDGATSPVPAADEIALPLAASA